MQIRSIRESDKAWVKPLFEKNKAILGPFDVAWHRYINSSNKREKWVVIPNIAFAHFLKKKNGENTLYEIAVDEKKQGWGKKLLNYIGFPMELKTDKENEESNAFYKRCGFLLLGTKHSKSGEKEFNIWKRWQ